MSIDNIHYRVATPEDQSFLDDMNVVAGCGPYAKQYELPNTQGYLKLFPQYAGYTKDFGREGDMGLIVLDDNNRPFGAVWARDYKRNDKDEAMETHPFEITIALRENMRKQGIGRQLLDSFAVMAWLQGRDELSLTVRTDNPVRRLYEAAGYKTILDENGKEARVGRRFAPMVRQLDFGPPALRVQTLDADDVSSRALIKLRGRNRTTINHGSTTTYSVVRGEGTMTVDGVEHRLKPGVTIEVPPHVPYFDEGNVDMIALSVPPFDMDEVEAVE